jgi:peptidoglycan/LPS O-acetylase OafA/YrhL
MTAPTFHSATIPNAKLLPGIHGLRGIAALAVVLFHVAHLAKISVPPSVFFIEKDFGYGVHLFFILSAFSLMHSTEHTMHRQTWVREYLVKRFWRIAPLFYAVLAFQVLSRMMRGIAVDIPALLLNLTFTFNFAPWSGMVMAGWTIGVEMLFYVLLPLLLLVVRSTKAALILVAITIPVSLALQSILHIHYESTVAQYRWNWSYFSFGSNMCFFAMGIYAYRLSQQMRSPDSRLLAKVIPIFSLALLGLLMLTELDNPLKGPGRFDLILWGLGLSALCTWQSVQPGKWCANWFFEYVGERSYSVYLLHPIVILLLKNHIKAMYDILTPYAGDYAFFPCGAIVIGMLLILSEVTYRLIEIPGIHFGQKISKRIRDVTG